MLLPKIKHPRYSTKLKDGTEISYRPMVGREEKILLMAKQSGEVSEALAAIKQVVGNCVQQPEFDVDRLSLHDLEWLFVQIRINSVSNITPLTLKDEEDGETRSFEIDLSKVVVTDPKEGLVTQLKVGEGLVIKLKWPEASLYTNHMLIDADPAEAWERIAANCLDKVFEDEKMIDCKEASEDELLELVADLPIANRDELKAFIAGAPRLSYFIEYKNKLDHDRKYELTKLDDFFSFY